jgi:MFS transporter, DHA1 family, tetracycline resistance protein
MNTAVPLKTFQAAGSRPRAARRAAFAFIFVTVALDMLTVGIIVPVLPKLIIQMSLGDMARAAAMTGIFGFGWAAMQFLFSPLVGAASDRFGRRPIVLLSNLGMGLDYVMMAIAPNIPWLFAGRLISGITAASVSTATAYISDVTLPDKRAAQLGMLGAAFGVGFVAGPALGGVLGGIDVRLPFWVAAGLSLANACYGYFVLPESLPPHRRAKIEWRKANPLGSLDFLRSRGALVGLAGATFLSCLAQESLPSCFVLYTDYRYRWTQQQTGLTLALIGVCSALVSGALVGPAVKRLGERRMLLIGLGFGVAGFCAYGAAPSGTLFLLGVPLVALYMITGPAMQALAIARVHLTEQGRLQGALSSLRGISGMIGPVLFTQSFAAAVEPWRTVRLPGVPYVVAAALLIGSLLLSLRLR